MELPEIPGYEPARPLGRNGCIVYLARRSGNGELVVLRVYDPGLGDRHSRHDSWLARSITKIFFESSRLVNPKDAHILPLSMSMESYRTVCDTRRCPDLKRSGLSVP